MSIYRQALVVLTCVSFSSIKLSYGCFNPVDGTSSTCSYGHDFWVPFPGIAVPGLTSLFQYRVYLTNPSNLPIAITMSAAGHSPTPSQTVSVSAGATRAIEFDASYMMQGEGIFRKYVRLTSSNNFSVYVMTTEKMDAFTALPVASWGKKYMAATYCGQGGGPCQIVVIAHKFTKVVVTLPVQVSSTVSPARPMATATEVTQLLGPGDVYQLQRNYDISGAIIFSNVSVGVVTGTACSVIVKGLPAGAFMEFLPPVSTLGSSFAVYKTPPWSNSSDFIRVVALNNGTNVYISTGHPRFQLQGSQYITRKFDQNVLLIEANQPVLVVKYSQHGQYPTMTYIPPTALYLLGETVIINEVAGLTNKQQFAIVVATKDFMQYMQLGSAVPITGTNMAAIVLRVPEGSGNLTLLGPKQPKTNFMTYSYVISDEVCFQTAVAFYQLAINQPCYVTKGSPGDQTDNDCDGQIDEDICSHSNYMSFSDCGAIISGDPDIWGQEFALQVPDHCQSSLTDDIVLLYVTARSGGAAIQVALDTPADLSKVRKTMIVAPTDNYQIFNLTGAPIKGNGSKLLSGQTLHLISSAEVSVTLLQVCTSIGSESIMTTRLIPCDVMGREYFAVTLCNVDLCQIQVAAFLRGVTQVRIRLRLQNGSSPFMFNSVEYKDGEVISVGLSQFQSLQLQSNEQDMTGTHILASKPVSVFSGGRYTMFKRMHMSNGFVEQLPPVETWGRYFIVQSSPVTKSMNKCLSRLCLDYLKIVAGTADTVVQVRGISETSYTLSGAGDFLEIPLPAVFSTVHSSKPILVLQLTQEVANIALSGSVVTAVDHYLSAERVAVPGVDGVTMYLMINMGHTNAQKDTVVINNSTVALTSSASLNASFYSNSAIGEDFVRISSNRSFGGHVYSTGNLMAGLFRLAYALTDINPVCPISKGVPGDNKDNDCDGLIDEEPCQPLELAIDADDDGMANEDCSSPPVSSSISASFDPSPTESPAASTSISLIETSYVTTAGDSTALSPLETLYVTTAGDDTALSTPLETLYVTTAAVDSALSLLETQYVTTALEDIKVSPDNTVFTRVSRQPSYLTPSSSLAGPGSYVAPDLSSSMAWPSTVTELALSPTITGPDSRASPVLSEHLLSTTRTTAGSTTSPSVVTNGIACGCHCPRSLYASVMDPSQVALLTQAIKKELSINKNDVSANRRKYISIDDHRPSAQTVGYFGIGIIMATFLGICLLDASAITRDIAGFIQLCRVQK